MFMVCIAAGDRAEARDHVSVKGREATFAVVLMTVDSQLGQRDVEGLCNGLSPAPPPKVTA